MWYWVLLGYMWCGSGYDQVRCGDLAHGLDTTGAGSNAGEMHCGSGYH